MIHIYCQTQEVLQCESVIIVPEKAIDEPGYILALTVKNDSSSKHEFHAMAQMAYFQYQDDELAITTVSDLLTIKMGETTEEIAAGMVLCRETDGNFMVFIHAGQRNKKLLEACYRFCTRWVRLDI